MIERYPTEVLLWLINATLAVLIGACAVLPDVHVDRSVDMHISHLRKKLGGSTRIKTSRGIGYQFVRSPNDEATA